MTITLDVPASTGAKWNSLSEEERQRHANAIIEAIEGSEDTTATTGAHLVDFWRRNGLIGFRSEIADTDAEYARLRAASNKRAHEG